MSRRAAPGAGALGLGLAAAVVLAAAWLLVGRLEEGRRSRAAWPPEAGRVVLDALEAPARVVRDRRGIPHLEAASEADALRALGYVHAQDRLGQMLWWRRVARGRAAELAGPEWVASDRRARVLGLGRLADAQASALRGEARRALEAYAQGVNARIARIRGGAAEPPRSLAVLGAPLEPWTAADSLAVVKLYAWGLADSLETSLVVLDLVESLGAVAARPFVPEGSGIGALPTGTEARRRAPQGVGSGGRLAERRPARTPRRGPRAPDPLRRAAGLRGPGIGSSAFVVGGRHGAGGAPLLAVDLHLEPTVPALAYEVHLHGGPLDAAGMTLPGVPVLWCGRNAFVAWAGVNARAVVADLYTEVVEPGEGGAPGRYHDGRRWRPLRVREETIAVRGAEPVTLRVRETAHGPLLDGLLEEAADPPLALAWAGSRTAPGLAGLLAAARARSAAELRRALEAHREPVLAFVYADARGEAGLQVAGWVPRRRLPTGLVPVPGRSAAYDWPGPVPFHALPSAALSGGRGWLVAADNRLPDAHASGIEWLWRPGIRAARIDALLREATRGDDLDLRALTAIQSDLRSGPALELVRDALELAERQGPALARESAEVAELLRAWDGDARAGSVGAAVYHVFLDRLIHALLTEPVGEDLLERYLGLAHADPTAVVADLLAGAARGGEDRSGWDGPERVARAVRESLRGTWLQLSVRAGGNRDRWTWGRLHPLRFRPLLPVPRAVEPGLGPFPAAGDGHTVANAAYDPAHPFDVRTVSAYRLAVDASEPGHALSSLAPGQSEHAGHPQREGGMERWLAGRMGLLATSPLLVEESAAGRLELDPGP